MTALYQDIWVKGEVQRTGQRECAKRYELIRTFCTQYKRPFTVLDVGAADGYFAVRLAEDFPDCTVVAAEPRPRIGEVLKLNEVARVLWLHQALSVEHVQALADVEHFDVTLALSVIHWMKKPPEESIDALRRLGDHLILELPVEDSATGQEVVQAITAPADGRILGYGESHLDADLKRPIYLLSQTKTSLAMSYWGATYAPVVPAVIASSFTSKTFRKGKKVLYPWARGINLQTFLALNGAHPDREHIVRCLRDAYSHRAGQHGDLAPWNTILQGDSVTLIDAKPGGKRSARDAHFMEQLVVSIMQEPEE
jgi:hypothetical protein